MNASDGEFDRNKAEQLVGQTSAALAAAMNCSLSYLGDQLGLYQSLADLGPSTSSEFAEHTGLHERWLREWLRQQACARQVDYDANEDRFSLSPEAHLVFCDEDSPFYFAAGFSAYESFRKSVDYLPTAFRSGMGMSFDDHGPECACGIEKLNNYVPRFLLVQRILPELTGMNNRLDSGIRVADVGCGSGAALLNMAKAYPNSQFTGYELSQHALDRFRVNLADSGLENVEICDVQSDPLPSSAKFDLICTFDVIHDVPDPERMMRDINAALNPDGTWLCCDIRSFPDFETNLNENPGAPLLYGFSLMVCLGAAMSQPGGAGLGTLGFNEKVAREMSLRAGFSRFRKLDYDNAMNNYYEIRH